MRYVIVAVYDRAMDAYMQPMFVPTTGMAIRSFQDEVSRSESPMFKHPEDYDLYELGSFDEGSGKFLNMEEPKQIAIGKQLKIVKSGVH